ncbi:SAM-dependent methyltransferase, MidA family [Noviherbaspirillum humi]|uniref:SAM-dependent methyltransferase, MidA family n=1 Tax=Noviherbaspirillum humi TaxID=1688639 RepID=A0A239BP82_9BURK|nr:SAM-dependent methyltransferase [Noviherbaspirillum humi]SNS09915.1 SAM-dependent methyltransferase, MidA family [Noviherbaspirillum humi]
MHSSLPAPSPDALSASQRLRQAILDDIRQAGGWIPFSRYMELALYAPDLGYYSGGSAKLGKDGDFTTAPEITPLFGQALARVAADLLGQTAPRILEFGAGSGKLAKDVLTELRQLGVEVERYEIVDLSGELRARQRDTLADFPQVAWLDALPPAFSGVVLGNEVLDAMPVELVVKGESGWLRRGVVAAHDGFAFADRDCEPALAAQIPEADGLPPGYLTEVHPVACGFIASLGAMLDAGAAAIFIDYGFPAHEYYLPQRRQGTLMCHYRHHSHADPFYLPGLQDITAHVDFSAMARVGAEAGLEVLCYTSQAAFLIAAGIGELLLRTPPEDALRFLPQSNALQKLVSPAEMGELFKVLVLGRNLALPQHLARGDRSHRL